jgi:hypothetical protein
MKQRRRRLFAVEKRLDSKSLPLFRRLLMNPKTTIEDAQYWLAQRGIDVSEHGIRNYRQRFTTSGLFQFQIDPAIIGDDAVQRQCLSLWAEQLTGDELRRLTLFAAFLLNLRAIDSGRFDVGMRGLIPLWGTGDRTPN